MMASSHTSLPNGSNHRSSSKAIEPAVEIPVLTGLDGPGDTNHTFLCKAIQKALLTAAFKQLNLGGRGQLSKWSKAMGRFGISSGQATDLFEVLDRDNSGDVSAEEFNEASLACPSFTSKMTPSMDLLHFVRLKYRLLILGCHVACEYSEKAVLSLEDFASALDRMGIIAEEETVRSFIMMVLMRQCSNFNEHDLEIPVNVLCHQLAIDGSTTSLMRPHDLLHVKHKLSQAIFMSIDDDRSAAIDRDEYMQILVKWGISADDGEHLFNELLRFSYSRAGMSSASTIDTASSLHLDVSNNPSKEETEQKTISLEQFCRAMDMDQLAVKSFRSAASARSAIAFSRVRRRLLMAAMEHIDMNESKQTLSIDDWCAALARLGVDEQCAGDIFVLLDIDHDLSLSINEVEHVLTSKIYLADDDLKQAYDNIVDGKYDHFSGVNSVSQGDRYQKMCDAWLGKVDPGTKAGSQTKRTDSKAETLFDAELPLRSQVERLVQSSGFGMLIAVLILINSVTIGLETDYEATADVMSIAEHTFTMMFLFEALLKLFALRWKYFSEWFNIFDLILVIAGIGNVIIAIVISEELRRSRDLEVLRIFRILRIMKVFRLMQIFRPLKLLISGLIAGMRTLAWTMVLLGLLIYICAIFVTVLLAPGAESEEEIVECMQYINPPVFLDEYFGDIGRSMFTMTQLLTLDSWATGIVRPIEVIDPHMCIFFIAFVCFSTFVILNLVTGIFLDQTLSVAKEDHKAEMDRVRRTRTNQMVKLKEIFESADSDGTGELTDSEFQLLVEDPNVMALFQSIGFEPNELSKLFQVLDGNNQGFVDLYEFINGMMKFQREVKMADLIQISMQNAACAKTLESLQTHLSAMEDTFQRSIDGGGRQSSKEMLLAPVREDMMENGDQLRVSPGSKEMFGSKDRISSSSKEILLPRTDTSSPETSPLNRRTGSPKPSKIHSRQESLDGMPGVPRDFEERLEKVIEMKIHKVQEEFLRPQDQKIGHLLVAVQRLASRKLR